MKKFYFLLILFFNIFCSFAQPGVLDATFNASDLGFGNGDGASSDVNCVAVQSNGKIIIGGSFTSFNGISRNYIARLNSDGTIDTSFNVGTGANNVVYSMAIQSDGKIVLAGSFTSYNRSSLNRIARLNGDGSLDTSFNVGTGANNFIYSLAIQPDGKILIGGSFTTYNAIARNRVARLNSDGSLDTDFVVGTAANSTVYSLAIQLDGKILIGGNFTTFNGTSRSRIARLNASGSMDTSFNVGTGANNSVYSIAVQSDGKILIGGSFTSYNSISRNYIARLNSDASLDTGFNVGIGCNNYVNTLAIQLDGKILIGGAFTIYNSISKNRIARLNTDGSLDEEFNTGSGSDSQVKDIEIQGDGKILIGGYFTEYNGASRNYMARLNGNGDLDSDFIKGTAVNGDIYTLAVQSDDKILIGGFFTSYNNTPVKRIARLNNDGSLDTSFNVGTGADGDVYSLAVQSNGKILIGGIFTTYNETPVNKIARLNTDGSLDSSFNVGTGADGIVYAIRVLTDGKILIGGAFTNYNDVSISYIARLNEDGTLDTSFNSGTSLDSYVYAMEIQSDGKIIIGGAFTTYNEISSNHIARLNVDGSLDTSFIVGTGADSDIASIGIQADGRIVIGGYFTTYNDTSINYIARLNSNGSLDTSFNVGIGANNEVYALALQPNGKILIGGLFTSFNGISRNRITRLNTDGSTDTSFAIGTGTNSPVSTLAVQSDGKILLGGQFTSYNNTGRNRIARIMGDSDSQIPPTVPTLNTSSTSNCGVVPTTLSIAASAELNSATSWEWYIGACGDFPVGSGTSIYVSPAVTTTYYARGEGVGLTPGNCGSVTITVASEVVPTFTAISPICSGGILSDLPTTSNNDIAGTWTPELNNSATTEYTFTPTSGFCASTTTMTIVVGEQPSAPTELACYQTATFNTATCEWTITGEQPSVPTGLACYQTAIFNTETCEWTIIGDEPLAPTELACYQTAIFNTTTCEWNIVGTPPVQPIAIHCWDNFIFDIENCSWSNIGILPATPTAVVSQIFRPGQTVSSLLANGIELKWYSEMIGGSTMLSSTVLGNQIYYVSQTVNGCESERIAVQVTLKLVLCSGAKVSDLTVIGGVNISWYTSLTTTTVLGLSTILSNRTYYYSQTNEEGVTARKAVIVTLDLVSNPTSITGASGTVCYGSGKILNLNASMVRGTIQWQSASIATGPFAPIVGATTTTMDTGSLNATTYFNAVVTNGVCPSKTTTTVAVTVRSQALSGSISGGGVVCSGTNSTKLTLSGYLGSIQWQSSTNNIDFVTILPSVASASYTALKITATTYYRVLVTNGLECIPVISESVMINVKSKPNAGYVTGPTLIPYNTAATLSLTGYEVGSTLQWKYGLTSSGTYFKGGQVINTSPIYTTAKLTKDYYYKVTVTKDGCSSDTAPFLADVNTAKFEDNTEKAAVFDVVGYPNPFSNYFTLDVTSPIKEPIVLTVFDLTGRLIETRQVQSTEIANQEIGKGYPSGVYNVLFTQEGNSKLLKMIKK